MKKRSSMLLIIGFVVVTAVAVIFPLGKRVGILASIYEYPVAEVDQVLACGDLFIKFDLPKPEHLEFIDCKRDPKPQYLTRAEYRVTGKYSGSVESLFVKDFNMPPLKVFRHTGWEPDGYGGVLLEALTNLDPSYELMVEMWGYARRDGNPETTRNYFELLPREEVPYFTVFVSIVSI